MSFFTVQQLEDDTVAVWLNEDPSYIGWVSSWHLTDTKANQLEARRQADLLALAQYHHDYGTGTQDPCGVGGCGEVRQPDL